MRNWVSWCFHAPCVFSHFLRKSGLCESSECGGYHALSPHFTRSTSSQCAPVIRQNWENTEPVRLPAADFSGRRTWWRTENTTILLCFHSPTKHVLFWPRQSVCRFSQWISHSENQSVRSVWRLQAGSHQWNKGLDSLIPFTALHGSPVLSWSLQEPHRRHRHRKPVSSPGWMHETATDVTTCQSGQSDK